MRRYVEAPRGTGAAQYSGEEPPHPLPRDISVSSRRRREENPARGGDAESGWKDAPQKVPPLFTNERFASVST